MNWFLSLLIGLLTGVAGLFSVGFLASLNVRWYRISSFEGGSGYYVVFLALLGGVVGMIVGIICSRIVAARVDPTFLKGLGVSWGSMLTLVFVIGVVCRLAADIRPEIDGKRLELAVEIRLPRSLQLPIPKGEYGSTLYLENSAGKTMAVADLDQDKATQDDGRWVVPATIDLNTSAAHKRLRAYFNKDVDRWFFPPLRSHPRAADLEWSGWVEGAWNAGESRPTPDEAFAVRYKVVVIEPPPPPPSQEEYAARQAAEEQARFDAIPADAPITAWLPYTQYGANPDRLHAAVDNMEAREDFVPELRGLMLGENHEQAAAAMYLVQHLQLFPPELNDAVAESGRKIIAMIRTFNATKPEDDPNYQGAADISVRFSAWMSAVRKLREMADGDFTPELQEILTLSRVREDSHCMQADVRRVASYYLNEWAGVAPLPGDPKPR